MGRLGTLKGGGGVGGWEGEVQQLTCIAAHGVVDWLGVRVGCSPHLPANQVSRHPVVLAIGLRGKPGRRRVWQKLLSCAGCIGPHYHV